MIDVYYLPEDVCFKCCFRRIFFCEVVNSFLCQLLAHSNVSNLFTNISSKKRAHAVWPVVLSSAHILRILCVFWEKYTEEEELGCMYLTKTFKTLPPKLK